ncbi:hypothetical protein NM208_g5920 [Fusarium decemcellulare]|uniref:Uncharacterized protein n=1 Tax=Fusarium decemcellulare TaxID=57161 RepID=A0ACC1SF10_9HYPO|nr:hypothetical protein NM208_g5920 [Fusarium decemcellulare]
MVVDGEFKRQVYLAFKDIFKGPRAGFRKPRAVLPLIYEYKDQEPIRVLLATHSADAICQTLCCLLMDRLFTSEERARLWFLHKDLPLPLPSPPATIFQPPQLSSWDFTLSRELASWIQALSEKSRDTKSENKQEAGVANDRDNEETDTASPVVDDASDQESSEGGSNSPKLDVYVPFTVEHLLLSRVQSLLEYAAFYYAQEHMPSVIEDNDWPCPTAGELNLWVPEFRKYLGISESKPPNSEGAREINDILKSAVRIRHIAVHRECVDIEQLQRLLDHAEKLCTILDSVFLDDIAARRAELDALEKTSIEEAHEKLDNDHTTACDVLEDMLLERDLVLFCTGKLIDDEDEDEDEGKHESDAEQDAEPKEEEQNTKPEKPSLQHHTLDRFKQSITSTLMFPQGLQEVLTGVLFLVTSSEGLRKSVMVSLAVLICLFFLECAFVSSTGACRKISLCY